MPAPTTRRPWRADGTVTPTGTVTYSFFDNGNCTTDANTTTDPVALNGDGWCRTRSTRGRSGQEPTPSSAVTTATATTPRLRASCEPFTVGRRPQSATTIGLRCSEQRRLGRHREDRGQRLRHRDGDRRARVHPERKVTYSFFDNGSCTSDANTTTDTVTLAAGVVPNSSTQRPSLPGATPSMPSTAVMRTTPPRPPAPASPSRWTGVLVRRPHRSSTPGPTRPGPAPR